MKQVNSKIVLCALTVMMSGLAFLLMMFGMAFFQQWKSGSRDMFYAPDSAAKHVAALKRIIFSDKQPALKTELNPIIYLFNSDEDRLSAHLRLKYDIPRNFRYSPIGILLQCNKDLFALLSKKHQVMITYRYGEYPVEEIYVDYVTVVPGSSWRGISSENLIFPTRVRSGNLFIEEIRINGVRLTELLELSPDGKILNPEKEKIFLARITELMEKEKERPAGPRER